MITAKVFENNRTQAVRLPVGVRFSDSVKQVVIRTHGPDRVLSPVDQSWDTFFLSPDTQVSDDFMLERADQQELSPREAFDD